MSSDGGVIAGEAWKAHAAMVLMQFIYGGYNVITTVALSDGVNEIVFCLYRDIIAIAILAPIAYFCDILAEHVAVLEAGARAWREVIEGRLQWTLGGMCRSGVERVRGWMVGLGNMRMELRLLDAAIVMAAVAIIITCLLYLLR
ncbi:hypothetical protein E3N88_25126 [Mikania micrantha]|uniref:Uncharacterized protein n=1 Tax=Mikania micrantha TaxID=192012 RepID=A0A5N6N6Q9_9ASTR|nr:hypothetical protein E3N88_25126 [Mikania micrantha]